MQHAGELCLLKAHPHKGVCNGHGKMTTARSGGGLSTGPSLSVHGAQGCLRKGQGLQVAKQDDGAGQQRLPGRATPATRSPGEMGACRTGAEE
jgi:hypothetical protein